MFSFNLLGTLDFEIALNVSSVFCRSYGFVTFETVEDAEKIIKKEVMC